MADLMILLTTGLNNLEVHPPLNSFTSELTCLHNVHILLGLNFYYSVAKSILIDLLSFLLALFLHQTIKWERLMRFQSSEENMDKNSMLFSPCPCSSA